MFGTLNLVMGCCTRALVAILFVNIAFPTASAQQPPVPHVDDPPEPIAEVPNPVLEEKADEIVELLTTAYAANLALKIRAARRCFLRKMSFSAYATL